MSISTNRLAVTTSAAVQLSGDPRSATSGRDTFPGHEVAILDCDVDLYLGTANTVTTATGVKLPAHTPLEVDLEDTEVLWAAVAVNGTAHVIRTGT